jgi:hypothetical protein
MCPSKFKCNINVRTAECHGPQSCLPVSRGISLVVGNVNLEYEGREEVVVTGEAIGGI